MLTLDDRPPLPLWRAYSAGGEAVCAFSTRRGGVSAGPFESLNLGMSTADDPVHVTQNRRRFLARLGLDAARVATAGQVHGTGIAEVDAAGHTPGCDALLTSRPDLALAVTAADCAPIAILAPGWVAAAHAGWRGTADGLPAAVVRAVRERAGADAGALAALVGPCIRGCCYEVGPEVARRFPAAAVTLEHSKHRLDLSTAIRIQLLDAGVAAAALFDSSACTACAPDWYFSHRRDAGVTGRHWGVVARRSDATSARWTGDSGARV